MGKPIALIDMDNTLFNYSKAIRRDYKEIQGPGMPDYDPDNKKVPYIRKIVDYIRSKTGWWLTLEKYEPGFQILEVIKNVGFEPHVCTKGPRSAQNSWTEKLLHVQNTEELKGVDLTITQNKTIVHGKILVDDFPEYLINWLDKWQDSYAVMPVHHYNEYFEHERVFKYRNEEDLDGLIEFLDMAYLEEVKE